MKISLTVLITKRGEWIGQGCGKNFEPLDSDDSLLWNGLTVDTPTSEVRKITVIAVVDLKYYFPAPPIVEGLVSEVEANDGKA